MMTNVFTSLFLTFLLSFYSVPSIASGGGSHRQSEVRNIDVYAVTSGKGIDNELIGPIHVCSKDECFSVEKIKEMKFVEPRMDGQGVLIGRLRLGELGLSKIMVDVRDSRSQSFERVVVDLVDRLHLNMLSGDASIYIDISDRSDCRKNCLKINQAAIAYKSPGVKSLFYSSSLGMVASIGDGVEVEIPAFALESSGVIYASVNSPLMVFPRVELAPNVIVLKDITISYDVSMLSGSVGDYDGDYVGERKFAVKFKRFGNLYPSIKGSRVKSLSKGLRSKGVGDLGDCLSLISKYKASRFVADMFQRGWASIKDCVALPPYVHIVVVGSQWYGEAEVVYKTAEVSPGEKALRLTRLTDYNGYLVMINGGLWNGDYGVAENSYGQAYGYVKGRDYNNSSINVVSNNSVNGGAVGYCSNRIQSITNWVRFWKKECPQVVLEPGKYQYRVYGKNMGWRDVSGIMNEWSDNNIVSSHTYVVKNGVCATGISMEKWSAFGVSYDSDRRVFVSSSEFGNTNVSELCQIFLSLGISNAILLDGGSSTQLVISGVLQNPLGIVDRIAFKSPNRPVGYGIGIRGNENPRRHGSYSLKHN